MIVVVVVVEVMIGGAGGNMKDSELGGRENRKVRDQSRRFRVEKKWLKLVL